MDTPTNQTILSILTFRHLKKIKVAVVGKDTTKSTYTAYVPMKGLQIEKASSLFEACLHKGDPNYTISLFIFP